MFGNDHPIKMGYHGAVSRENHVRKWCNLGQSDIKGWLFLVGSTVGVKS
jgi:hypothetical protein